MSKKTLAVIQICPGPGFLAKPTLRFIAQLPESRPSVLCPALVCGEICQVLPDQSVNGRIMFGGMPTKGDQDVLIYAESDLLHKHSICVIVLSGSDRKVEYGATCDSCLVAPNVLAFRIMLV